MIEVKLHKRLTAASGDLNLDVDIRILPGELVALYGASGAGKTSILRMLAGLFAPERGLVRVKNEIWFDHEKKISLKPQQRNVGFVFQDYGLFPNMSVRDNIAYGLSKGESFAIVDELIRLMELQNLEMKKPHLLSGGQRQRIALARALARRPSLLLLDEPLAALDTALRLRMQDLIQTIHEKFQLTTILVSHDLFEVARLAQRVFLLEDGKIARSGKPADVVSLQPIEAMLRTIEEKFNYRKS